MRNVFEVKANSANGNGNSVSGASKITVPTKKAENFSMPPPGVGSEGVASPKHTELDEYGYNFGHSAKVTGVDEKHIEILTNKAKSAALETQLGEFNPTDIPADKETEEKLDKLKGEEEEVKEQLRKTEGDLLNAKIEAADSPAPSASRPEEPVWQVVFSAILLAIPFAPTFYEFWKIADVLLNWLTAVLFSLLIGIGLAKLLFFAPSTKSSRNSRFSSLNLVAGIGVALGLGIFRLAISDNFWIAVAFTAVELFFIILVHLAAENHKQSIYRWDEESDGHRKPKNLTQILSERASELKIRLENVKNEIEFIRGEFYHRYVQSLIPEKVEENFINSILAGYFRAIAENKAEYETHVRR